MEIKRKCWGCGREIKIVKTYIGNIKYGRLTEKVSNEALPYGKNLWVCNSCVEISKMDIDEFKNKIKIHDKNPKKEKVFKAIKINNSEVIKS